MTPEQIKQDFIKKKGPRPNLDYRSGDDRPGMAWDAELKAEIDNESYRDMVQSLKPGGANANIEVANDGKGGLAAASGLGQLGITIRPDKTAPNGIAYFGRDGQKIADARAPSYTLSGTNKNFLDRAIGTVEGAAQSVAGVYQDFGKAITGGGIGADNTLAGLKKTSDESGLTHLGKESWDELGKLVNGGEGGGSPVDPVAEDIRRVQKKAAALQEMGIGEYKKSFDKPMDLEEASASIANENRTGVKDQMAARKKLQNLVAMRGLGGTSAGIGSEMESDRGYMDKMGTSQASLSDRVKGLQDARAGKAVDLSSSVMRAQDVPIDFYGQPAERVGGIAPLLGAGLGAYFSPEGQRAEGAQVGMGMGQYYQGTRRRI